MINEWFVYILECSDKSLYTGITKNIPARLAKHNSGKGAKYTRSRRPCRLVYFDSNQLEHDARIRELEIQSWPRAKKKALISGFSQSKIDDIFKACL